MYEAFLLEEIFDGVVLSIDDNYIVTYSLIDSSFQNKKPDYMSEQSFNAKAYQWKKGTIKKISISWLELKK